MTMSVFAKLTAPEATKTMAGTPEEPLIIIVILPPRAGFVGVDNRQNRY